MSTRDRWLVNLGFDAGWSAHEQFETTKPDPSDPTDLRAPSFERVASIDFEDDHTATIDSDDEAQVVKLVNLFSVIREQYRSSTFNEVDWMRMALKSFVGGDAS